MCGQSVSAQGEEATIGKPRAAGGKGLGARVCSMALGGGGEGEFWWLSRDCISRGQRRKHSREEATAGALLLRTALENRKSLSSPPFPPGPLSGF